MKFCQKNDYMKTLSLVFGLFFKLLLLFLFVLIWVRYFVDSLIYSIIISAIITATIDLVSRFFLGKRKKKKDLLSKEKKDAEAMFLSLAMEKEAIPFLSTVIKKKEAVTPHKTYITFKDNDKKVVLLPILSLSPTTINDIAQSLKNVRKEKCDKILILGGEYSKDCYNFINIFDEEIILLDKYQTYKQLYQKFNTYPKIIKQKPSSKQTWRDLLTISFNPARSKSYLFSALALLFCSLFTRNTLYYSIVASILLLFSIISLSNPFSVETKIKHDII